MARVQQAAIDKARKAIGDLMSSPAFPSREVLLESRSTLYNVVTGIRANDRSIPDKTICRLLAESLDLRNDVSEEALWKRFRRVSANRDGSYINGDTTEEVQRTAERLSIPLGISQTDLATGLAGFFESQGYTSASLLKTCLVAMDRMTVKMDVSEIKGTIDAWHHPQDSGDYDSDTVETEP